MLMDCTLLFTYTCPVTEFAAFKYGKFLLPPRFLTALSVPKVPTREQLRLYNARKKCKANKFASSRQMWYITYSDEICLFLEKRRENKTYEENKI